MTALLIRLMIWRSELGMHLIELGARWCYLPHMQVIDQAKHEGLLVIILSSHPADSTKTELVVRREE